MIGGLRARPGTYVERVLLPLPRAGGASRDPGCPCHGAFFLASLGSSGVLHHKTLKLHLAFLFVRMVCIIQVALNRSTARWDRGPAVNDMRAKVTGQAGLRLHRALGFSSDFEAMRAMMCASRDC